MLELEKAWFCFSVPLNAGNRHTFTNEYYFLSVQFSDLEKEKTMIELEVKELIARHKSDMLEKGAQISQLEELNQQLTDNLDQKLNEKDELNAKIKGLQEGMLRFMNMHFRNVDELKNHFECWKNIRRIRKSLACGCQSINRRNLWSIA